MLKAAGAALLGAQAAPALEMRFIASLVPGNGQIPGGAFGAVVKDPTVALARRWLARFAEHNALERQYDLECDRLIANPRSREERAEWDRERPLTQVLTELDARIATLYDERVRLAETLTATPAQSFAGAAAKVAVARELIDPKEDEDYGARPLLERALADLSVGGCSG